MTSISKTLVCQNCNGDLSLISSDNVDYQFLTCGKCAINTPVINGIGYFTATDIRYQRSDAKYFNYLKETFASRDAAYAEFISQKRKRGTIDLYSSFQPFNESSRAFYPFITLLKKNLKPGDIILDTWCRTGWSALFLAGLFPEQRIISIWEGNKDVLGYDGFNYWLPKNKRPKNVEVIFHDIDNPLPFKTDSVSLVYGLDTLHRYQQHKLVPELLRILNKDGIIIFPHIHLTNARPDPFFERGERQLHGNDYQHYFEQVLAGSDLVAYVVSEPKLFSMTTALRIYSDPDMKDYNALIAILPEQFSDVELQPFDYKVYPADELRILTNPLLKIDLSQQIVYLDKEHLDGMVGSMLDRHQVYLEKIRSVDQYHLTTTQTELIYSASQGYSVLEICDGLNSSVDDLYLELDQLVMLDIVHVLPISELGIQLQQFHTHQKTNAAHIDWSIPKLLKASRVSYDQQPLLVNSADSSEVSFGDALEIIDIIHNRLLSDKIVSNDNVLICANPNIEAILLYWALTSYGVTTCIVSTDRSEDTLAQITKDLSPRIVFTDASTYPKFANNENIKCIIFDGSEAADNEQLFSNWLHQPSEESTSITQNVHPDDIATILYTSGSTGRPKGVKLSHRSLYMSGKIMAETYDWSSSDKLLVVSELDSMSGLRNICLATLFAGVTIVIPSTDSSGIFAIISEIEKHKITIITATPALVKQLIALGSKISQQLSSLRQVICTGGVLPTEFSDRFQELFGIVIHNYYGLTETTGICIGEPINPKGNKKGSIGIALEVIGQIIDDHDRVVKDGQVGHLRIYSNRHMSGYHNLGDNEGLKIKNKWLYTGDLAVRDEDGYYFLKGRSRDIIKNEKGEIVYFSEVEDCINSHPQVYESVALTHTNNGIEQLIAFVVSTNKELTKASLIEGVKQHIKEELHESKMPSDIVIVDAFEMTQRGKVDKKSLLESYTSNDK